MPRARTLSSLADVAEDQWGLVTRRQAEATGMAWTTLSRLARDGAVVRVAHGVYRVRGVAPHDRLDVYAAWLQLAPEVPAWERTPEQGVVSHRSAAALYELGHLPADIHEFTFPQRRQTRREDVRLHRSELGEGDVVRMNGVLVTPPARIVHDLLADREDLESVAQVVADALRGGKTTPAALARVVGQHSSTFGFPSGAGGRFLAYLVDLTGDPRLQNEMREISAGSYAADGDS